MVHLVGTVEKFLLIKECTEWKTSNLKIRE